MNDLVSDLPLTIIAGRISSITVTIPWRNILSQSCKVEIEGAEIVAVPSEQVEKRGKTKKKLNKPNH